MLRRPDTLIGPGPVTTSSCNTFLVSMPEFALPHLSHTRECGLTVGLLWVGKGRALAHHRDSKRRAIQKGETDDGSNGYLRDT